MQNEQYPNNNRKKRNQRNVVFTVCVISALGIIAAAGLVTMALVNKPASSKQEEKPTTSSVVSANPSSTGSITMSSGESSSAETSSATSDIQFSGKTEAFVQSEDRLLAVVNNTIKLPDSFKKNLTNAFDAKVDKSMVDDWEALYSAGEKKEHYYWITYSYRSEKDQTKLYNSRVKTLMEEENMTKEEAKKEADQTTQKGGSSEYMTGLSIGVNTVDDAFGESSEYTWLKENSYKYGFIIRYPKDKEDITGVKFQPWRLRYVGRTHAKKMHELNLCLEEYVQYLNGQNSNNSEAQ